MGYVDIYLKNIDRVKLLTADQERELLLSAADGDEKARQLLIEANLRLVVSIAKGYMHLCNHSVGFPDLIQAGNIGLMHAIKKMEVDYNTRLSTYATYWIRQTIYNAVLNCGNTIRIPIWAQRDKNRPKSDKIVRDVARAKGVINLEPEHYVPIDDPKIIEEEEELRQYNIRLCLQALDNLEERKRFVIECRYFKKMTLKETGEQMGITRERVRQIEMQAIRDMKELLNGHVILP